MMNRWILRGLVTAGFAGAAWAIGSTAASADTTTTTEPDHPVSLVVTLDTGRTGASARTDVGLGRRDGSRGTSNGGESSGVTADLGIDVTGGRPAPRRSQPPAAATVVTAGAAPVSTSDSGSPAGLDAAATVSRSTSGDERVAAAALAAPASFGTAPASFGVAVVLGPAGTGGDSGSGSGTGSGDLDTGTDPETDDGGAAGPGAGAGLDAVPDTVLVPLGVFGTTTVDTTRAVGGNALARTGTPAAGLAMLALLMMLAGAAMYRVGARRWSHRWSHR